MTLSRRGIFGLFAAAPAAIAATNAKAASTGHTPAPKFYKGEIRAAISHFEPRQVEGYSFTASHGSHSHTLAIPQMPSHMHSLSYADAVAVIGYEQWNGERWVPITRGAKD